jgi:hypothetical protein
MMHGFPCLKKIADVLYMFFGNYPVQEFIIYRTATRIFQKLHAAVEQFSSPFRTEPATLNLGGILQPCNQYRATSSTLMADRGLLCMGFSVASTCCLTRGGPACRTPAYDPCSSACAGWCTCSLMHAAFSIFVSWTWPSGCFGF